MGTRNEPFSVIRLIRKRIPTSQISHSPILPSSRVKMLPDTLDRKTGIALRMQDFPWPRSREHYLMFVRRPAKEQHNIFQSAATSHQGRRRDVDVTEPRIVLPAG
jgi:hypothetical protein